MRLLNLYEYQAKLIESLRKAPRINPTEILGLDKATGKAATCNVVFSPSTGEAPYIIKNTACLNRDLIFDDDGSQLSERLQFERQRYMLINDEKREMPK